jgi:spore coat protein A, manganese oxidase
MAAGKPLNAAKKWKDELPLFTTAMPTSSAAGVDHYDIEMHAGQHTFHSGGVATNTWRYVDSGSNTPATSAGVLFDVAQGQPITVTWKNRLDNQLLADVMSFGTRVDMPHDPAHPHDPFSSAHAQVHLHGGRVDGASDGKPDDYIHPGGPTLGVAAENEATCHYPNAQQAGTLWFHDHTLDITRLNVYAGLAGVYVIRAPQEAAWLPTGDFETAVVLSDRSFNASGTKLYYDQPRAGKPPKVSATPEFKGTYPTANGRVWPVMHVKNGTWHRFRFINGANARFFNLSLKDQAGNVLSLHIVGVDGGFLDAEHVTSTVLVAPGERIDLVVDLSNVSEAIWHNNATVPYSTTTGVAPAAPGSSLRANAYCSEVLKVIVGNGALKSVFKPSAKPAGPAPGATALPANTVALNAAIKSISLPKIGNKADTTAAHVLPGNIKLRRFVLEENAFHKHPLVSSVPGVGNVPAADVPTVFVNGEYHRGIPDIVVAANSVEVWEFINRTVDVHPMHVHLVEFSTHRANHVGPAGTAKYGDGSSSDRVVRADLQD